MFATTIRSVKVDELFKEADLVATVRILSGDSEHYDVTVYKAQVVKAYKGASNRETIYFGPYVSYGIGNEYVVFLSKSGKHIAPKKESSGPNCGKIPSFFEAMYAGFGVMPIKYVCLFEGEEPARQCDDAVKVNPEQIGLPHGIRTYPAGDADATTNYSKWVRKDAFLSLLETFEMIK